MSDNNLFRSKQTVSMIREEKRPDGSVLVIQADLPIGRGWNQGNGTVDWINLGWRSADEYYAAQHKAEVAAKREAEAKEEEKPKKVTK